MSPPDRSRPARTALLARLAALAGLAAACGSGEATEPAPILRLADALERAAVLPPADPAPEEVIFDAGADPSGWRPVVRLRRPPTEEEVAAFEAGSEVREDGTAVVGPAQGSWLRTVPVEGGRTVLLRGHVEVASVSGGAEAAFAEVALAELSPGDPAELDGRSPSELAGRVDHYHATPRYGAPTGRTPFALLVTLAPETTAVALVLAQHLEEDAPAGGARFTDLRLSLPDVHGHAAHAAGDPALAFLEEGPARGGYTVGRVRRDGFALAPGTALRWRIDVPADGERFEAWAGLVPHDDFPAGRPFRFRAAWALPGREQREPLALFDETAVTGDLTGSRWSFLGGELPEELRGRAAVLEVSVQDAGEGSPGDARPRALPVVGTPRVVPARPARPGPNIVLVSLDTLRADHVGAYGYERETTPHLDALAEESLLFEDVWAQGPYTLPSHMSLLSGQHPSVHGVQRDGDARDPLRTPLLAEILRAEGWTTAAFTGGGYVHPSFGFGSGFDLFCSLELVWNRESDRIRNVLRELPDVDLELAESRSMEDVASWIAAHRDESFFLFFHTYAAHEFDPPAHHLRALGADETGLSDDERSLRHLRLAPGPPERPVPPADARRLVDLYDGGVRQADEAVGVLVEALRTQGLWDDTILVVVSDHGEEIGEHGEVGHGHTLYEEMLQVPLLLRVPGTRPGRVSEPAMLVDVVPTLLAILGLDAREVQGHDLRALPTERALFSEVDNAAHKHALRRGALKTIHGPPREGLLFPNERLEESYDLARDPGEEAPLPEDPARLAPVLEHVEALTELGEQLSGGRVTGARVDPALRAQLDALGYGTATRENPSPAREEGP